MKEYALTWGDLEFTAETEVRESAEENYRHQKSAEVIVLGVMSKDCEYHTLEVSQLRKD